MKRFGGPMRHLWVIELVLVNLCFDSAHLQESTSLFVGRVWLNEVLATVVLCLRNIQLL